MIAAYTTGSCGILPALRRVPVTVSVLCLAALVAPSAFGKGDISVRVGDGTPRVGQRFTVYVRTGYRVPADDWLRLIAVAPGKSWYDVVGVVTGDSTLARATIPRDGFGIPLVRTGRFTWRATVSLPRAGTWRLVVPNFGHAGFMVPPPAAWMPWVRVGA